MAAVKAHVSRNAKVYADKHGSCNDISGLDRMGRVNHAKEHSSEDGTDTNFVESFFSRIERAHVGIHHRFSTRYLDWYAADDARKEDMRRMSNRWQTRSMRAQALRRPT